MPERREAAGGTLVVGGGFAGAYVARLLGKRGATIVNPDNFMLYTPLLPEAAAGTLEPRHVVVPLRQMCPHAELLLGRALSRDSERRTVVAETLGGTFEIAYERLVVALGAVPRTFPIPGLAEHGRGFKDVADAIALRNHLLRSLESAAARLDRSEAERDLGFVFVGGGYAGVEALAELNDLAHAAVHRSYPTLRDIRQRWVLVDAAQAILSEIPPKLGEYTHRYLERRGIEIHVGTTLASFDERDAVLADGTRIPARTLVWAAGVRPSPALATLALPLDDRGRVPVDATLRVEGAEDVCGRWATARRYPTSGRPVGSTRRPASTPCARHVGSRRTSRARRSRTGTACSARSRRSAVTRASPSSRACGFAGSSAGSSRGRTTSTRFRRYAASRASSPTGRCRSSSSGTSSSSPRSGTRATSTRDGHHPALRLAAADTTARAAAR
jgi:NADH dehydrogenase FAD-containing subunit